MSDEVEEIQEPEATTKEQAVDAVPGADDKLENVVKWVNRQSTELGQLRKELTQLRQPTSPADGDDFDEAQIVAARKLIARAMGVDPQEVARVVTDFRYSSTEALNEADAEFFEANKDVTREAVYAKVTDLGVDVTRLTPRRVRTILAEARKSLLSSGDHEAEIAKRVEARLAELAPKKGEEVIEVRPKKGVPTEGKKSMLEVIDDPHMSFFEKLKAVAPSE